MTSTFSCLFAKPIRSNNLRACSYRHRRFLSEISNRCYARGVRRGTTWRCGADARMRGLARSWTSTASVACRSNISTASRISSGSPPTNCFSQASRPSWSVGRRTGDQAWTAVCHTPRPSCAIRPTTRASWLGSFFQPGLRIDGRSTHNCWRYESPRPVQQQAALLRLHPAVQLGQLGNTSRSLSERQDSQRPSPHHSPPTCVPARA